MSTAAAMARTTGLVYLITAEPNKARTRILGSTPTKVQMTKGIKGISVIPEAMENTLKGTTGINLPIRTLMTPYFLAKASAL